MAAKAKTEQSGIGDKINDLIQKHRKPLLISLIGIIGVIIIMVAVFSIRDSMITKAFTRADEFDHRYSELKNRSPADQEAITAWGIDLDFLVQELADFEKKNSGYAAARAYAVSAAIYEDQKNWAQAENAWIEAAKAAAKTYFSPVAYFNAAVAAEEQGENDRAIEWYTKALEFGSQFPAAPRAQFSIGRIYESMGNKAAAIGAYQALVVLGSRDQLWVNLAHSRILVLSMGIL